MTQSNDSLHYRPDIDGLRAISVIAVVAFHALPHRFPGGFIGVDVFFVISGFLISSIILTELRSNQFSLGHFYSRRIRRLFPALIIILAGSWLFGWLLLEPKAYANLGANMLASAGFVSNIFLYSGLGYFDAVGGANLLLHLWSLGVEEQFYIFWPVALCYLASGQTSKNISFKIILLIGISFVVNAVGVASNPAASFYLPFGRVWELLTGALLANFGITQPEKYKQWQQRLVFRNGAVKIVCSDLLSFFGIGLIVTGFFLINEQRVFPGYWALIPVFGAACVIVAGSQAWLNRTLLSHKWVVAIGLISYPLYLTHWPLLIFSSMFDVMRSHDKLRIVIVVISALGLSYLIYQFVEKPLRLMQVTVSKSLTNALLLIMLAVAAIGVVTTLNGFVARYPIAAQPFLTFSFDENKSFRTSTCLLSGAERVFSNECWEHRALPQLLIWGDSHGAMLYQALDEIYYPKGFGIAQYTSSSCPPFLAYDKKNRPLCRTFNDEIIKQIAEIMPKVVVLAHDWPQSSIQDTLDNLPRTIDALRKLGIAHIVLIGPVPHWTKSLPSGVAKFMRETGSDIVPRVLRDEVNHKKIKTLDTTLSALATDLKIEYISPYFDLCTDTGCLVWLDDIKKNTRQLTSFDNAHLMPLAAKFLLNKNLNAFGM